MKAAASSPLETYASNLNEQARLGKIDPLIGRRPEIRRTVSSGIREIAYALRAALAGRSPAQALPITLPDEQTIVVGEDRLGKQVPLRDKLRPLMALLMLMMEALALAGEEA